MAPSAGAATAPHPRRSTYSVRRPRCARACMNADPASRDSGLAWDDLHGLTDQNRLCKAHPPCQRYGEDSTSPALGLVELRLAERESRAVQLW